MARQPRTIKQRIALDGGRELKKDLSELGRNGEKAFDLIQKAAKRNSGSLARLGRSLQKVRADFVKVRAAAQVFGGSLSGVGSNLGRVARRAGIFGGAIAGITAAVGAFIKSGANLSDETIKLSQGLGLSVEGFSAFAFAASQSGVDINVLRTGLARLSGEADLARKELKKINLGEALSDPATKAIQFYDELGVGVTRGIGDALEKTGGKSKELTATLNSMGIRVTDGNGKFRSMIDLVKDVADAFAKMPDGVEKTNLSLKLFGQRAGPQLVPFLNEGRRGIEALENEAKTSSLAITKAQGKISEAFNDSFGSISGTFNGLRQQISFPFQEALTPILLRINEAFKENTKGISAWSQSVASKYIPVLGNIVDALIGNDEAVRSQNKWILDWRDNIIDFAQSLKNTFEKTIVPIFKSLLEQADGLAAKLNGIFGTELTGKSLIVGAAIAQVSGAFSLLGSAVGAVGGLLQLLLLTMIAFKGTGIAAAIGGIGLFSGALAGLKVAGGAILAFFAGTGGIFVLIGLAAVALGVLIVKNWDSIVGFFKGITRRIKIGWDLLWDSIGKGVRDIAKYITSKISGAIDTIIAGFKRAIAFAKKLFGLSGSSGGSNSSGGREGISSRYASGGSVRGPGTGTSDSILARLSNGEFVVRAKAVREYGPGLLEAINSMRLPKNILRGFADGGMVNSISRSVSNAMAMPIPAFAMGGQVNLAPAGATGRPVNVTIGGDTFAMFADDAVADRLARYSNTRQISSSGRTPSWYAGGRK